MWVSGFLLCIQVLIAHVAVPQVQISLASERVVELRQELDYKRRYHEDVTFDGPTEQAICFPLFVSDTGTDCAMSS